jgi:hypothetical protein
MPLNHHTRPVTRMIEPGAPRIYRRVKITKIHAGLITTISQITLDRPHLLDEGLPGMSSILPLLGRPELDEPDVAAARPPHRLGLNDPCVS